MIWRSLALALLIIVSMGASGREAFSRLSGLQITSGSYDLQEEGAIIRAQGRKNGVVWEVLCLWQHGFPRGIVVYDPKVEI